MTQSALVINGMRSGCEAGPAFARLGPTLSPLPAGPRAGWWLNLLGLTLLGYALLGKGWAYIGVPPLFVGEAVLLCGVLALIGGGSWRGLLGVPAAWFLLILGVWGVLRTLPDVSVYGADALRDAAIWGYGAFALLVFGALRARPARLAALLSYYRWFGAIFLVAIPFITIPYRFFVEKIPHWPWADVPILATKGGDVMVHLSGILAFSVAGLGRRLSTFQLFLVAFALVLVGTIDRAGLLSFIAVCALCFLARPRDRSLRRLFVWGLGVMIVLAVTDLQIKLPQRDREISFRQLVANVSSSLSDEHLGDLDDTKQWRLDWWDDILSYTVHGRYFWEGKGFGVNLADDDGYQVEEDGSLRSPHSGHMNMLARGGVPGFLLWILVQLSWALGVLAGYVRSRRLGQRHWNGLFLFLFAYWMAFMINAAFDVFLEGPMGGIWFWTLFGVGLAAMWLHKHHPGVLSGDGMPTALRTTGERL